MPKFPSDEWIKALMVQVNKSDGYRQAAATWEGDFFFVVNAGDGVPNDVYLYMDLWHGECRASEYLEDPSTKEAEFKITASMEKWQRVLAKKLDPVQGMVTRQIKLDGNLVKIMKNVKAAQELVRCATTVDTEYA